VSVNDIARVYASSLIDTGQENNILPEIEEEIKFLADLITENNDVRQFLNSPGIPKDAKKDFVEKVFKGRLSDLSSNFLNVLIDNDRQSSIVDISHAVIELMDDVYKRQRITVISSVPLDTASKNKLTAKLKENLKKDVILNEEIDESILGGIIIKIGDNVIDGSLSKDLRNITNTLLNSKVRSEVAYED
jgi:F-type H+-transporting ATPase subunit delta